MTVYLDNEEHSVNVLDGSAIHYVSGSCTADSRKGFNTRKGMAWSTTHKLQKVWASESLKVKFFRAWVEPVLLSRTGSSF